MDWDVPVELTPREKEIAEQLDRIGKFYVFLRKVRHRLFDDEFEKQLKGMYGTPRGTKPLPPAMLAMVTLLQAYEGRGDADAVVTAKMDRRWQLVLGNLDEVEAPFSQGSLPNFRNRLQTHGLDAKLLERTVELARETGLFGWQKLKATLDASPLIGAGRVEDEFNLIARAMEKLARPIADYRDIEAEKLHGELGLTVLKASSFKAAFDIRWSDQTQRKKVLNVLVDQAQRLLETAKICLESAPAAMTPTIEENKELLETILDQNLEPDPDGPGDVQIRDGVAEDRICSVGDPEMRHGRKSDKQTYDGYQRHILRGTEVPLIFAAMVQQANRDESEAAEPLIDQAGEGFESLNFDRGYLNSDAIAEAAEEDDVEILCKPWPQPDREYFGKEDFEIDLDEETIRCPAGHEKPIPDGGGTVCFGALCDDCPLRDQCTEAKNGRHVSIHPQEELMQKLRDLVESSEGRQKLRNRTYVEHGLARIQQHQGRRARYKGQRRNTLDLRRHAAVANLQAIAHAAEEQDADTWDAVA